jgi:hypothetical protein
MADERRTYVEDPRFAKRREDDRGATPITVVYDSAPKKGCLWSCCSGCLMFLGLLFIVLLIAGYFAFRNLRHLASFVGAEMVKASLDQIDLPEAEKAEIGIEIDRLSEAFRDGRITSEQAAAIVQQILASPLATSIIVSTIDAKYLSSSGLSDEEKAAGRKSLARFARGVLDHRIPEANRDATLKMLATKQPDDSWQLKQRVSDDELRVFLAAAKTDADAVQIPDQPEMVDPSAELKTIVDGAVEAASGIPGVP